ncbi:hypothetical protein T440DRAFT_512910 [Plenodomus tracheiphilus IPT5]|uniref:Uncharacterized protein n=1 Tax=Plenodomus tracheiphilus IPT5 TaxID=1408161 RepID=A0A6A7BP01_9PLEO|nr:hypothetical protein T440DRAFT_512910 [Plenodomus tracheiphilus IPT5]
MHFTTLLFPLALALSVSADPVGTPSIPAGYTPARQFQRSVTLERRDDPEVNPELLCGANYKDCGDGWCCSASQECVGKIEGVPVCKDPTVTFGLLGGTEPAMPYDDLDAKISSLSQVLATLTGAPEAGGAANTAASTATGAAAANAVNAVNGFGSMATLVAGLWGVAALGGAGLFLL